MMVGMAAFVVAFVAGCAFVGMRLGRLADAWDRVDDRLFSHQLEFESMRKQHYQAAEAMKRVADNFNYPAPDFGVAPLPDG